MKLILIKKLILFKLILNKIIIIYLWTTPWTACSCWQLRTVKKPSIIHFFSATMLNATQQWKFKRLVPAAEKKFFSFRFSGLLSWMKKRLREFSVIQNHQHDESLSRIVLNVASMFPHISNIDVLPFAPRSPDDGATMLWMFYAIVGINWVVVFLYFRVLFRVLLL